MERPLVSVIIPTYKRADMLPRAIASVLNQTYSAVEVIVVDDNNPDTEWRKKTEQIMFQYCDETRVKYVKHLRNQNGSVARNTGIQESNGDIIAFLDDDDVYYEDKLKLQVDYLLTHPEKRAVYCGWDRDGIVIPTAEGDCSYELLSGVSLIYTNVILMWKKDAVACGGWDESFKRHQEAAFLLRYFRCGGKIGLVPKCLVKFDTSDRSNAAKDGKTNEDHMTHYLTTYSDCIDACEKQQRGSKKNIISYRYRGVLLNYIRLHEYRNAFELWWKICRKMPIKFNLDIIRYAIKHCLKRK